MTTCHQCQSCCGCINSRELQTPEAQQFLARVPSLDAYKALCCARAINTLVETDVWSKTEVYLYEGGPLSMRLTNMRKDSRNGTVVGSVAHTPNIGSSTNGSPLNHIDIDYNPASGGLFTATSATMGGRRTIAGGGDPGAFIGTGNKTNLTFVGPNSTLYSTMNSTAWHGFNTSTATTGLLLVSRNGNETYASLNGVPLGKATITAETPTPGNFKLFTDAMTSPSGTTSAYASGFVGGDIGRAGHRNVHIMEDNLRRDLLAESQPVHMIASYDLFNNGLWNVTPDVARLKDGRLLYVWSMRSVSAGGILHGALSNDGKTFSSTFVIRTPASPHNDISECRVVVDPVTGGVLVQVSEYKAGTDAKNNCKIRLFTAPNPMGGPLVFTMYTMPTTLNSGNALSSTRPCYLSQSDRWVTSSYDWDTTPLAGSNRVNLHYFTLSASMVPTWISEEVLINGPVVSGDRYNEISIHEVPNSTEIMIFMRNGDELNWDTDPHCGYDIMRAQGDGEPFSAPVRFFDSRFPGRPDAAIADDRTVIFIARVKSLSGLLNKSTAWLYSVPPTPLASPGLPGTWSAQHDYFNFGDKWIGAHAYSGVIWDAARGRFVAVIAQGPFAYSTDAPPCQLIGQEWKLART